MKFYNVTFNIKDNRSMLEPTIPDSAGDGENKTIKRICLTDSIEHCMQAIAVENRNIKVGVVIVVRSIDIEKLDRKLLICPAELKQRGYVPDALENNEFWYLGNIQFEYQKYRIMGFDAEVDLAWTCIPIQNCKEVVKHYIPDFPVNRYKITYNLYKAAMEYCNQHKMYDIEDIIWEDLSIVPWAQKRSIKHVDLMRISG